MIFFRLSLLFLSILFIVGGLLYINSSKAIFYTFVVAFSSSAIVVLASFKNYKNMVDSRVETSSGEEFDDRDTIDKLEDPYNLYDEIEEIDENQNIKDIIKAQKAELKKNKRPVGQFLKDSARAFNYIRLIAYAILVIGFFALLKSNNLNIFTYLATLIIPNIVAVIFLMNTKTL